MNQSIAVTKVIKLEDNTSWEECKSKTIEYHRKNNELKVFVSKNISLTGKITHKIRQYPKNIILLQYAESRGDNKKKRYAFIDDSKIDTRSYEIIEKISDEFYLYQFYHNKREYILLTKDDLEDGDYLIEGALINCPDSNAIGENFKINIELPLLYCVETKSNIIAFKSTEQFKEYLHKIQFNWDEFLNYIFTHKEKRGVFRFPKPIENLVLISLFSLKFDGYPIHILFWGPPNVGKSLMLECIDNKFNEGQGIIDSGGSTLKALIPSFKGTIVNPGSLAKASRFCLIDEFLRIIIRTGSDTDSRDDMLGALNTLLEHKKRMYGSGNCEAEIHMTARCLLVTNPVHMYETITKLFTKVNSPFISRLFTFPIQGEILKELRARVENEMIAPIMIKKYTRDNFISIIDYLQSFQSEFDKDRIKKIFSAYKTLMPQEFHDVYSRYQHHIYCLIDGLIKIRCLKEGVFEFTAKEEDYLRLQNLLDVTVKGWIDFNS